MLLKAGGLMPCVVLVAVVVMGLALPSVQADPHQAPHQHGLENLVATPQDNVGETGESNKRPYKSLILRTYPYEDEDDDDEYGLDVLPEDYDEQGQVPDQHLAPGTYYYYDDDDEEQQQQQQQAQEQGTYQGQEGEEERSLRRKRGFFRRIGRGIRRIGSRIRDVVRKVEKPVRKVVEVGRKVVDKGTKIIGTIHAISAIAGGK